MTTDVFDIATISTTTGFHIAVGPAPETSLPSFAGHCPIVHSYYPTSMSPVEMLCDEVEKGSIELVYILDEAQLPFDPTYVKKLHRNEMDKGKTSLLWKDIMVVPLLLNFIKKGNSSND